jgi:hypothetical protein
VVITQNEHIKMRIKALILAVLAIFMTYTVDASQPNVHLSLIDARTGAPVSDTLVSMDINGAFFTNSYIGKNNTLDLFLSNGVYTIELRVEDLNTPGKDYYAEEAIYINESLTREMVLFPVGTVNGNSGRQQWRPSKRCRS